jgi:hypothetical protein
MRPFAALRATRTSCLALLVALVALAPLAMAQDQPQGPVLPEADKQAILKYNVTEDSFTRLAAATEEARKAGIKPNENQADFSKVKTLDDLANTVVASDPRIKPLIAKHGFTPREFLLVNIALSNAAMAIQAQSNPEQAKLINQAEVNTANVAFVNAHRQQIAALMQGNPGN